MNRNFREVGNNCATIGQKDRQEVMKVEKYMGIQGAKGRQKYKQDRALQSVFNIMGGVGA